ncbi:putative DNA excision repair protein [Gregarina niphandrodes]|uniref:DNA excision repair protein n=1 Tax=Gregarina niphandrodes TaxID=110365 RepID=A0A023BC84_GRENI|nr:putative DNA excision repair protein [Gregarina niphandrodes]EZG82153.1 putative DNA excision repair protein [Gregarina niphandrodes]|eukprot:XP_011129023.1 putative DNA excision repair protein [Gregarina niphandrodes]
MNNVVWLPETVQDGVIIASEKQRENPLIAKLKEVRVEFLADLGVDFVVSRSTGVSICSLRYLRMSTMRYIQERMELSRPHYRVCICLVHVDCEAEDDVLLELNRLCFYLDHALFLTWSLEEMANVLSSFKIYEKKRAEDYLQPYRVKQLSYMERAQAFLCALKPLTTRDADILLQRFGSIRNILNANKTMLMTCHGIGQTKADAIVAAAGNPFFQDVDDDEDDDDHDDQTKITLQLNRQLG